MRGLILNDILSTWKNLKSSAFKIILFLVFAIIVNNAEYIIFFMLLLSFILSLNFLGVDTVNNWGTYKLTFPVKREKIILGKYILIFSTHFISLSLYFIFSVLFKLYKIDLISYFNFFFCSVIGSGILLAISILIYLKYGYNRSISVIIMLFVGMALLAIRYKIFNYFKLMNYMEYFIILTLFFIMIYISYKLAVKIYIDTDY